MDIYYTVDRSGSLQPGDKLALDSDFSLCRMFPIQGHFDRVDIEALTCGAFPSGLSSHGKKYFLDEPLVVRGRNGPAPFTPHMPMIELVTELVRRLEFPDHLSRFQAFFLHGKATMKQWLFEMPIVRATEECFGLKGIAPGPMT